MSLALGSHDHDARPADVTAFLRPLHESVMPVQQFRGEGDGEWRPWADAGAGAPVAGLQTALGRAGFRASAPITGVFDYHTLSAVRLFQEYVRTVESITAIGTPDGVVGPHTQAHLDRWTAAGKRADWSATTPTQGTLPFRYWVQVLNLYHGVNVQKPLNKALALANTFGKPTDTRKLASWRLEPAAAHLLGIRRQEWRRAPKRQNDDLFILLTGGLAFSFAGSTDPNPSMATRPDEPYLVAGQHQYRFGWHKLGDPKRVYRAFRPVGPGVLACRDALQDDALTEEDLAGGLSVVPDINIHWSGAGTGNWSAGCQVVDGRRYINHLGNRVDCASFAAPNYGALPGKTRGAYNVLLDLISAFAPSTAVGGAILNYTLIHERDLEVPVFGQQTIAQAARADLPDLKQETVSIHQLVTTLLNA